MDKEALKYMWQILMAQEQMKSEEITQASAQKYWDYLLTIDIHPINEQYCVYITRKERYRFLLIQKDGLITKRLTFF